MGKINENFFFWAIGKIEHIFHLQIKLRYQNQKLSFFSKWQPRDEKLLELLVLVSLI
jgi:hypothetical protein